MRPEEQARKSASAPATIEAWARGYVLATTLAAKTAPAPPPPAFAGAHAAERLAAPGRPPELDVVARAPSTPKPGALVRPEARAELLHRFWHHELQAAELFAWALLAFPETPEAFRRGLVRILLEEVGHMRLYAREIERLGFALGDFPVRDWFWERVPTVRTPASFVALVGLGLEGANLDHAPRWADALRAAGDARSADVEARVGDEEERHVAFAREWFERFTGAPLTFAAWSAALPAPLTPLLMRGKVVNHAARVRAGLGEEFVADLAAWQPS